MTDTREIVERLRDRARSEADFPRGNMVLLSDAAAEIDRLAAELAQAREMLQACRDHVKFDANSEGGIVARIDNHLAERDRSAP